MRPAFLVEGITEQRFIQIVCRDSPVKTINCNGSAVQAGAIAKRAASLIRLWGGRYFPIIILVDREDRVEAAEVFRTSLENAIRAEGVADQLVVGVADRMIENWMLANADLWTTAAPPDSVDGFSGSSRLRKLMPAYDKAAHGPDLLSRTRCSELRKRSASFRSLYERLSTLRCRWLRA